MNINSLENVALGTDCSPCEECWNLARYNNAPYCGAHQKLLLENYLPSTCNDYQERPTLTAQSNGFYFEFPRCRYVADCETLEKSSLIFRLDDHGLWKSESGMSGPFINLITGETDEQK